MEKEIQFETLIDVRSDAFADYWSSIIDVRSDAFADYWSSIIGKLRKSNPSYREMEKQVTALYEQFPKVQSVLDSDKSCNLTEEECDALLKILTVQSRLTVMQQEAIYLRGCYDGIGYLKKAGLF